MFVYMYMYLCLNGCKVGMRAGIWFVYVHGCGCAYSHVIMNVSGRVHVCVCMRTMLCRSQTQLHSFCYVNLHFHVTFSIDLYRRMPSSVSMSDGWETHIHLFIGLPVL
jgi:hypothetical protein